MKKFLIVGEWRWPQYEAAFARGLRENGAEVYELSVAPAFSGVIGRAQHAIAICGPAAIRAGNAVLHAAREHQPNYVLFWRPRHPLRSTIRTLRKMGIFTITYNNDDPFYSPNNTHLRWHQRNIWRLYKKALADFDLNFFYRNINVTESAAHGALHGQVMLPYFVPWSDTPILLNETESRQFNADASFVGHFESDGRDQNILALARTGLKVRVWGDSTWEHSALVDSTLVQLPIIPALGDDYRRALCGSKISLCFLSKNNRDKYTRRCFEIPAVGRAMLAERTSELTTLFREDEEACFFSSQDELIAKARLLIDDFKFREKIARGGMFRVWKDGHDVVSRARQFMKQVEAAIATRGTTP